MTRTALLPDARVWPELWDRLAAASCRALLLDFDGTLAPFSVDRDAATLAPRVRELLAAIAAQGATALAIVSGRRLAEIEERFDGIEAHLIGEHGWEERLPGGARRRHLPSPRASALLDAAAASLGARLPPRCLEVKRTAIVLHARGETPERVAELAREVALCHRPLRHHAELDLREIDGGWELRARGHDKGTAVGAVVARLGGPTFAVYLGDDETDEDAFGAVAPLGFGVRVGSGDRPTRARARLPGVPAVEEFLALWAERFAPRVEESRR